jgi:hypothetical protein
MSRRGLKRMAQRMVGRAGIQGEEGMAVAFGFKSLAAAILVSVLEELPYVGALLTFVTFPLHRIVLATDKHTYVFSARPFHRPKDKLAEYSNAPGTATLGDGFLSGGQVTFNDGHVVWHSPFFAWRIRAVVDVTNSSAAGSNQ